MTTRQASVAYAMGLRWCTTCSQSSVSYRCPECNQRTRGNTRTGRLRRKQEKKRLLIVKRI